MNILSVIKQFVNKYISDIMLIIGVILISLISFYIGYIVAREEMKPPLIFEEIEYEKVNKINLLNENYVFLTEFSQKRSEKGGSCLLELDLRFY